jgi:hypothetical protein
LKALGLQRGALAGALMVVVHERYDRPMARQLSRVEHRIRGRQAAEPALSAA